jgi:hypothetical protein
MKTHLVTSILLFTLSSCCQNKKLQKIQAKNKAIEKPDHEVHAKIKNKLL